MSELEDLEKIKEGLIQELISAAIGIRDLSHGLWDKGNEVELIVSSFYAELRKLGASYPELGARISTALGWDEDKL